MVFIIMILSLVGCTGVTNPLNTTSTIIDWVDFVKLNNKSYTGVHEAVIADPAFVLTQQRVGTVKFKVDDVVTNSNYQTKDGDAAFLEIGTPLYEVQGFPDHSMIAAKDEQSLHGYKLFKDDSVKLNLNYKDIPKQQVTRIEIYKNSFKNPNSEPKIIEGKQVKSFIALLDEGKITQNYQPDMSKGDPTFYDMIFYTDKPYAYKQNLQDDGMNFYFYPWNVSILSRDIGKMIE